MEWYPSVGSRETGKAGRPKGFQRTLKTEQKEIVLRNTNHVR